MQKQSRRECPLFCQVEGDGPTRAGLWEGHQLQVRWQADTPCPHGSEGPALCGLHSRTFWPCLTTPHPGHSLARSPEVSCVCPVCPAPPALGKGLRFHCFSFSSLQPLPQQPQHTRRPLVPTLEVLGEGSALLEVELSLQGKHPRTRSRSLCTRLGAT